MLIAPSLYIYKGIEDVPKNVTHVLIHSSISIIEKYVFKGCSRLVSVTFKSNSVVGIARSAFAHCTSLQTIILPHGLKWIGENAFRDCTALLSVHLPNTLVSVGIAAFRCCKKLKIIDFPPSIERIGFAAFYHCEDLVSVSWPSSSITLASIQLCPAAFRGCSSLVNIILPSPSMPTLLRKREQKARINMSFIEQTGRYTIQKYPYFSQCETLNLQNEFQETKIHEWLQQRYKKLLLHQECYQQSVSLTKMMSIVASSTRGETVEAKDELGMTVLHILACNSYASSDMMKFVLNLHPQLATMKTLTMLTPLELFFKCQHDCVLKKKKKKHNMDHNNNEEEDKCTKLSRISLKSALHQGLTWRSIDRILVLDPKAKLELHTIDETSGLIPSLIAAVQPQCKLDVVYGLACNSLELLLASKWENNQT